jgi:hypothetical protein
MATSSNPPNRLLAASRVVHQLFRTQDNKIDLNRLLADEAFAREVMRSARVYADPKTSALVDDFEKSSIESGAWSTKNVHATPAYTMSPDGMVSAAAAWDPNYNPPPAKTEPAFQQEHIPTTSPRTSMTVKDLGGSSFISRFGLSRPLEAGDASKSPRSASASAAPSTRAGSPSSQTAPADPPDDPVDPNHKKYIRGAR